MIKTVSSARRLISSAQSRRSVRLLIDMMRRPFLYKAWFDFLDNGIPRSVPQQTLERLALQPSRNYLRRWFGPHGIVAILCCHYQAFVSRFSSQALGGLYTFPGQRIAELVGKSGASYGVTLHFSSTKEGEVALYFWNASGSDFLALLRGVFAPGEDGRTVFWIGALQGPGYEAGKQDISATTRDLNGLRPKQAILHALSALCGWAGVGALYAPRKKNHVNYRWWHDLMGRRKILADYDSFWEEYDPATSRRGDFVIPLPFARRRAVEVPSKKRKEWLARYARIDAMAESIRGSLNKMGSLS